MQKKRVVLSVAVATGLLGLAAAAQIALGAPGELEIALGVAQFRRAVESRSWPAVAGMLDPQTCSFNQRYQDALQDTLGKSSGSRLEVEKVSASLLKQVEPWRHVRGEAELVYTDPQTGRVLQRERLPFYLVKRYGRLWLDCGSG